MRMIDTLTLVTVLAALLACKKDENPSPTVDPATAASIAKTIGTEAQAAAAPDPAKPKTPDLIVAVSELLDDYKGNELAADGKYKGKLLGITGAVDDIKKDIMGDAYVTIGTGKMFELPQAQAFFAKSHEDVLSTLKKKQVVAVVCRCEGLMMNVLLKDCVLVRDEDGKLIGSK